jgi:hypothetical protein
MPQVDPEDDSIWRITLRHYVFDPVHRERRHVDVVTLDNEAEFLQTLRRLQEDLEERRVFGAADQLEHYTGLPKEPGYEARRQSAKGAKWVGRGMASRGALMVDVGPTPSARVRKRRRS